MAGLVEQTLNLGHVEKKKAFVHYSSGRRQPESSHLAFLRVGKGGAHLGGSNPLNQGAEF